MDKVPDETLVAVQTYIPKKLKKKFDKRRGDLGYISESDYVRDLIRNDVKNN